MSSAPFCNDHSASGIGVADRKAFPRSQQNAINHRGGARWPWTLVRAVLFDVDGTLVDSNAFHIQAWRKAFAHYGIELTFEQVHEQTGKGGDQMIPVFCSEEQVAKFGEALDKLQGEIFRREYLPLVRPFPEVRELFERLRADGIRIALATSSKKSELEVHIGKLGVGDLITAATSADDAEHSKPAPDIFEAARGKLGDVRPDEAIVIGDTPYDVEAAGRAGVAAIAFECGGWTRADLRGAREIYGGPSDLVERYETSILGGLRSPARV